MKWSVKCPIQGTLKLTENPLKYGIGVYQDIDGIKWDILGVYNIDPDNKPWVQARKVGDCPEWYSTSTSLYNSQSTIQDPVYDNIHSWKPYNFEVVLCVSKENC